MGLQFSAFPRIYFFQPHVVCATPARCQGFASREEAPLSYVLSHLECYYLKTGLTSVGRKGINITLILTILQLSVECDILVNDKSVSRKHADIELQFKGEMCEELTAEPRLYLIDKSKFGTFLNGEKCKEQRHLLKDRDQIRFGVNDACTYQVSLRPLIIFWEPASLSGKSKSLIVKQTSLFGKLLD